MSKMTITVFGSSRPKPGEPAYQQAYELGTAIGRQGWSLANGGYGGTMEATAAGAKDAGATTIAITCDVFGPASANCYIDQEIRTVDLNERLGRLIELGDSYIVLPGGMGTLLELAAVWELLNKRLVTGKCLVVIGQWWTPVVELIGKDNPDSLRFLHHADGARTAVGIIAGQLGK
jgi:uncharacterized protein (TIGR00730 family)